MRPLKPGSIIARTYALLKDSTLGLTGAQLSTLMGGITEADRKRLIPTLVDLKHKGLVRSERSGAGLEHTYFAIKRPVADKWSEEVIAQVAKQKAPPLKLNEIPIQRHSPKPQIDLSRIIDDIAKAVADALATSLQQRIADVVHHQVQSALDALPSQLLPSKAKAKPPQLKVTVVGLHASQMSIIEREFGKELNMSFVSADEGRGSRLKSLCANSHAVITMSDFIDHATVELIRSCGGNHVPVAGGMTHLRDALTEIYVGEMA